MRHISDIEADLEGLRVYVRQHPDMRLYIEPKQDALRMELRAALAASAPASPAVKAVSFATALPLLLVCCAAAIGFLFQLVKSYA